MTRRERERRRQRIAAAAARAETCDGADADASGEPARPSDYGILQLQKERNATEVDLYARVSTKNQDLSAQVGAARAHLRRLGIRVRRVFRERAKGRLLGAADRPQLHKALDAARRDGIPLLAVAFSRFLRSADYHAYRRPDAQPTAAEVEAFLRMAEGVRLATINDPDAEPVADETFMRQMLGETKRKPVGRPPKKATGDTARRRHECQTLALAMSTNGMSATAIADEFYREHGISIDPRTIRYWAARARKNANPEDDGGQRGPLKMQGSGAARPAAPEQET
jgi:hypothetical protein